MLFGNLFFFFELFLHYSTIMCCCVNAFYLISCSYASADPGTDGNGLGQMISLRHPKSGNLKSIHYFITSYRVFCYLYLNLYKYMIYCNCLYQLNFLICC